MISKFIEFWNCDKKRLRAYEALFFMICTVDVIEFIVEKMH